MLWHNHTLAGGEFQGLDFTCGNQVIFLLLFHEFFGFDFRRRLRKLTVGFLCALCIYSGIVVSYLTKSEYLHFVIMSLSFLHVTRPQTQPFTGANDNYLRHRGYVIIVVCLSRSNFAQKLLTGFA